MVGTSPMLFPEQRAPCVSARKVEAATSSCTLFLRSTDCVGPGRTGDVAFILAPGTLRGMCRRACHAGGGIIHRRYRARTLRIRRFPTRASQIGSQVETRGPDRRPVRHPREAGSEG